MMRNLPVPVEEEEIEAMFEFADKDKDGKINYRQGKREISGGFKIEHSMENSIN